MIYLCGKIKLGDVGFSIRKFYHCIRKVIVDIFLYENIIIDYLFYTKRTLLFFLYEKLFVNDFYIRELHSWCFFYSFEKLSLWKIIVDLFSIAGFYHLWYFFPKKIKFLKILLSIFTLFMSSKKSLIFRFSLKLPVFMDCASYPFYGL